MANTDSVGENLFSILFHFHFIEIKQAAGSNRIFSGFIFLEIFVTETRWKSKNPKLKLHLKQN